MSLSLSFSLDPTVVAMLVIGGLVYGGAVAPLVGLPVIVLLGGGVLIQAESLTDARRRLANWIDPVPKITGSSVAPRQLAMDEVDEDR